MSRGWINTTWPMQTVEENSAFKRKETLPPAPTWTDQREPAQWSTKGQYHGTPLVWGTQQSGSWGQSSWARGWGGGGELVLDETHLSWGRGTCPGGEGGGYTTGVDLVPQLVVASGQGGDFCYGYFSADEITCSKPSQEEQQTEQVQSVQGGTAENLLCSLGTQRGRPGAHSL